MGTQGGTKMYCPSCEEIQICKAVPAAELGLMNGQRWHRTDYPDLQWFRRVRRCLDCDEIFVTVETREDFIGELVELRDALSDIKINAEKYIKESVTASRSLEKLSKSLSVLKALDLYKQEDIDDDDDDE